MIAGRDGGKPGVEAVMLSIERTLVERLPWLARRPAVRRPLAVPEPAELVAAGLRQGRKAVRRSSMASGPAPAGSPLDALGVSLPMLYRQYVGLVEPDGVQFQGFGGDSGFSGCVDAW